MNDKQLEKLLPLALIDVEAAKKNPAYESVTAEFKKLEVADDNDEMVIVRLRIHPEVAMEYSSLLSLSKHILSDEDIDEDIPNNIVQAGCRETMRLVGQIIQTCQMIDGGEDHDDDTQDA